MCIDAQRRNLSSLSSTSSDHPPLTMVGIKRLMVPVCVTVAILGIVLFIVVASLYESLSYEMNKPKLHLIEKISNVTLSATNGNDSDSRASNIISHLPLDEPYLQQKNSTNNKDPLYYLSTSEGLLSHFFQLQHIWSLTHALGRSLTPIPFHSESHHPDVEWIHLCDIFVLPSDINCFSESIGNDSNYIRQHKQYQVTQNMSILTPPTVVKLHDCILLGIYPWALDPKIYSLPHPQIAEQKFDFLNGDCVAGYVDERSGFTLKNTNANSLVSLKPKFPIIKFTDKYMDILKIAKNSLGLTDKDGFTVVHWYRNNEPKKCKEHNGNEDGCLPCNDFIQQVNMSFNKVTNKLVYVATDENNKTVLNDLSKAGFKLFTDLKINSNVTLNSLDRSVLELILVAESTNQLFWGPSHLKTFSELVHQLKNDKS